MDCMRILTNRQLNSSAKLVYLALCERTRREAKQGAAGAFIIYPELELGQALSLSRNTVVNAMQQLKKAGFVKQVKGCGTPAQLYLNDYMNTFGGYQNEF
ncbi:MULTISPECIES: GntR family transcriptional regulator [Caproicibacterium]|uniref:Helix-turn-helix domain-containing protein n=1 Tax=Caproicibacterium argilliputei TaxID=3030016 RepID=A0AA97DB40_9FIRM|nr:hypothetical protein [Caproicibacterium argilliputei]WOC32380.1 hypothetical protein PXC00_00500 [Caproicibacterium argilliputei]